MTAYRKLMFASLGSAACAVTMLILFVRIHKPWIKEDLWTAFAPYFWTLLAVGIVLAGYARLFNAKEPWARKWRIIGGLAIAGLVIEACSLFFISGFLVVYILPNVETMQVQMDLKKIGSAILEYEHSNGQFPPQAKLSADGKPLLSWRVLVLPQLGEHELYCQFNLNEPWDSPHNIALLEKIPLVFQNRRDDGTDLAYHTRYQVFVGFGCLFETGLKMTRSRLKDGPSDTILLIEAKNPVPWTKPDDLVVDQSSLIPQLGFTRPYFAPAMYVDGEVGRIRTDYKGIEEEKKLRALISPNGGENGRRGDLDY